MTGFIAVVAHATTFVVLALGSTTLDDAMLDVTALNNAARADTVEGIHYRVYLSDGTPSSFAELIAAGLDTEALLIGETHDDPIAHALEHKLLVAMHGAANGRRVALTLEMFETDVQQVLDEYLADLISETHFKRSSRPWGNYDTDYRPSVEYAREHGLAVVATNAPRRYVSQVTRKGPQWLESLPETAKRFLPPLPYEPASPAYKAEWDALMAESMAQMQAQMDSLNATKDAAPDSASVAAPVSHGTPEGMGNALDSQSLWDASMAYVIARQLTDYPGTHVVHFVGAFHVENGTGIPEHLARYRPGTDRVIVSIRPHEDIEAFDAEEFAELGDFVILTDKSLPRTQR